MVVNDQNQITEAIAYQPYGTIVPLEDIASSPQTPTRQQFTGKEFDQEGGTGVGISGMDLYYFGKRYYNPELGVWLSTDPKDQLFNPYAYSSNPIMTIDPDGQYIIGALIGGAVGFAAGGLIGGAMNDKGWSWSGAFQGMMMGGSLGSGIENGIMTNAFQNGYIPKTGYGLKLWHHLGMPMPNYGSQGEFARTDISIDANNRATAMDVIDDGDPTVYVRQNGKLVGQGAEPPRDGWFYTKRDGKYILVEDGYKWVGNSWGSEIAWRTQFGDRIKGASHWRTHGFSDFKETHPFEFGNAWGNIMTSRDVGNAMWGSHVARNYGFVSRNGLQTISNRVAGGVEDSWSWSMQLWGYNNRVTF